MRGDHELLKNRIGFVKLSNRMIMYKKHSYDLTVTHDTLFLKFVIAPLNRKMKIYIEEQKIKYLHILDQVTFRIINMYYRDNLPKKH